MSQSDNQNERNDVDWVRDPLNFEGGMGKNNKPPNQPDYIGAANAQSYGSIQAALANNLMSSSDTYSPLGSQTREQIGESYVTIPGYGRIAIPKFKTTTNLSPEQQKLYESQTGLQQGLLENVGQNLSQPFNQGGAQDIADKAYGALTSRLDPQWEQREDMQKTQLANQGLAPGGEAYTNAMRDLNNARTDAYQQANLAAIQTMPQTLGIEQQIRDLPLDELNRLRGPASMPQFPQIQTPGMMQGPQTLAATGQQSAWEQAMYNAQVQAANANKQGLMGLGAAGLMAFSDRRLKSNIVRIGHDPRGFGVYEYDIFGERKRGVMADEVELVMPDAVTLHPSGFKMVDYGRL